MIVLATGGRTYKGIEVVFNTLDALHAHDPITFLIEGGANGADWLACAWRESHGVDGHSERANWSRYQNNAGRVRNCKMLREHRHHLDVVVAFPGGHGTQHMCRIAAEANVPVVRSSEPESLATFLKTYRMAA